MSWLNKNKNYQQQQSANCSLVTFILLGQCCYHTNGYTDIALIDQTISEHKM